MSLPVLFLVSARGGSRRLPDKNLRTVAGIPLVAHAIRIGRQASALVPDGPHAVVLSTDDPSIAAVATAWHAEVPWLRPDRLATATSTSVDVVLHALDELAAVGRQFRAVVLLQPTSPLTAPTDVAAACAALDAGLARSAVSVVRSHPAAWHVDDGGANAPLTLSSARGELLLAGAFYAIDPDLLRRERLFLVPGVTVGIEVPVERAIDVDELADLQVAEALARARPASTIEVGGRAIGNDEPAFVIAEAGVNHDGDIEVAHRLVDAAADAHADAVKFQTFEPETLAAAGAPLADYQTREVAATDQRAMLAGLALSRDSWPALQVHAADRGITFLSSPFDEASADLLVGLDVPALKVASGELTNHPFLAHLAATGRPLLVSTGMADMREVADALEVIAAAGDPPIALFHCVSSYPADPSDANLRAIATLRAAFGHPTGWSDHSLGIELPTAAVALGAALVEKHITLDRGRSGPDHRASLEPAEFGRMVAAIRSVERALGDGIKAPTAGELATAAVARRSLHWRRDILAGSPIAADDVVALRPATGLLPSETDRIVGGRTARDVRAGRPIADEDIRDGR
jgi:N-acetylneuraminate synthase/N,N'-diacetyllegionaminate synthase